MLDNSSAKVSSAELITLQSDLIQLSKQLHELYDLMNSDVSNLSEYWRDQKFDEFLTGYKPQMDKMEEISERYNEWATKDLQTTIENVIETEGVDVSGGTSVSSSPASDSDNATPETSTNPFLKRGKSKAERFNEATQRVQDKINNQSGCSINPLVQKKYNSEKTHKEGMDSNEREYPQQNMFAFLMKKNNSR